MAESRAFITNTSSRDNLDSGCSWRKPHCGDNCFLDCVSLALSARPVPVHSGSSLPDSSTPWALQAPLSRICTAAITRPFIEGHTLGTWDMPAHGDTTVHSITPPSYSPPLHQCGLCQGQDRLRECGQRKLLSGCVVSPALARHLVLSCPVRPLLNPAWLGSRGASGGAVSQP